MKVYKCDQSGFVKKWYRFMGAAGSAMPTKCVAKNHCGTHAPGWLSGSHPTQAQGTVTRKVCFNWSNKCCNWNINIRVRNCGGFYVYELSKTPHCHLRYCGNAGPECQKYTVLKDADRASGHVMKVSKCDQSGFVKKWYRFTGAAGSAMPTKRRRTYELHNKMKLYLIAGLLAVLMVSGLSMRMDATLEDDILALLKRRHNDVSGGLVAVLVVSDLSVDATLGLLAVLVVSGLSMRMDATLEDDILALLKRRHNDVSGGFASMKTELVKVVICTGPEMIPGSEMIPGPEMIPKVSRLAPK
ncbi:hypothetical protein QZH41_006832 [Actinostola sp. cb2023]|nr:hypothetical protein QZH41_006832 [Actinostola sp. cb2023]